MPIRPEYRYFYPTDWPQLSAVIRFRRAGGACEGCGRPNGRFIYRFRRGRWWDASCSAWRDGQGKTVLVLPRLDELKDLRRTKVVLAAAHRAHDTSNNAGTNLVALCQRCHILYDRPEHQRRRLRTLFRRKAAGDLFQGLYG